MATFTSFPFTGGVVSTNPKTIRLYGIVSQENVYLVIGWRLEPSIPPTDDIPAFRGSLKVNGVSYPLASGARPGVEQGADGLYWIASAATLGFVSGQPFSFEFG